MPDIKHLKMEELESGLDNIKKSPLVEGILEMIVCRPEIGERTVLEEGRLDPALGLVGDNWKTRGSSRTNSGFGHPEMQLNIMNSRMVSLLASERGLWKWAGDQLFVDFNLSDENLPPGSRLKIGSAVIEVTPIPHNGCRKFTKRFGVDAVKFVNSSIGKQLHLRGINAKVIEAGDVRTGDAVTKI